MRSIIGIVAHCLGAASFSYLGCKSLPLIFVSGMVFDAPGSERLWTAWLLFLLFASMPFVSMLLAMLFLALVATMPFGAGERPHPFVITVDAVSTLYLGGVLLSPLRKILF